MLEDAAYLTAHLELSGRTTEWRRHGCHIVVAEGKSKLPFVLAIAQELKIPTFVMFEADGDETKEAQRRKHETDNLSLFAMLGLESDGAFPRADVWGESFVVWAKSLRSAVEECVGNNGLTKAEEAVRQRERLSDPGLEKNPMFVAEVLAELKAVKVECPVLDELVRKITGFAEAVGDAAKK